MPDSLRLRQICLAAPRLAPVVDDLQTIFGLSVCHRDPKLIAYGLENALLPIGTDFLEVVAPVQPNTAAGRFIHRSQGHGGYMAIFQAADPRQRQAAALALGVRTAHEIDQPGYLSVQLHAEVARLVDLVRGAHPQRQRGGLALPGIVGLEDRHVAAVALRALDEAAGCGVRLHRGHHLQKISAYRQQCVLQPVGDQLGVAVAHRQAKDHLQIIHHRRQARCRQADLAKA